MSQGQDLATMVNTAVRHLQEGRLNDSRELLQRVLNQYPEQPDALHFMGLLAHRSGDIETAIRYLDRAHRKQPDNAWFLSNHALVLKDGGEFDRAADLINQALQKMPGQPRFLLNLGIIYQAAGKLNEAVQAYREANTAAPDNATVLYNLATVYQDLGQFQDAISAYRHICNHFPAHAEAHNNLAYLLSCSGFRDTAEYHYYRALEINPDYEQALTGLSGVLFQSGKHEDIHDLIDKQNKRGTLQHVVHMIQGELAQLKEDYSGAEQHYRSAIELAPDFGIAYHELTHLRPMTNADLPLIEQMESLLDNSASLGQARRVRILFSLGKACADLGDHDRAFSYYKLANDEDISPTFSNHDLKSRNDLLIEYFSTNRFTQQPIHPNPSIRPLFIAGMPRSGKTLLEKMLAAHPDIVPAGEQNYLFRLISDMPERLNSDKAFPYCLEDMTEEMAGLFSNEYLQILNKYSRESKYVTSTVPSNAEWLGLVSCLLPNAKIIQCCRTPLDNCLSIYFKDFNDRQPYARKLTDIGFYYLEYKRLMDHWHSVLPINIYKVDYENMVQRPEYVLRDLMGLLDLEWTDQCLRYHEADMPTVTVGDWEPRQPLYETEIQIWKHYEKHLSDLKQVLEAE